ncbi:MAG: DUF1553 domain-containing protein [Pedosphaera sp.]|nr:DUF1553 domain-containing protein [Pedosphaera sp.]
MAMIAITTSNSIRVKPALVCRMQTGRAEVAAECRINGVYGAGRDFSKCGLPRKLIADEWGNRNADAMVAPYLPGLIAFLVMAVMALFPGVTVGRAASIEADRGPVSFRRDVMAALAKGGCSSGACHGNRNGKGGFRLSLRGEDPDGDYTTLVSDLAGRRIDREDPDQSLLLLKPTGQVPHEGGVRFETSSWEYRALHRWIAGDVTNDIASAAPLERLEVQPREQFVRAPEATVALTVAAHFKDGTRRDVTHMAVYEPAHPIVSISPIGRVQAKQAGETTVLVRYLDQQAPATLAFLPAREKFVWSRPAPLNAVDVPVFKKLELLRLNPAILCSDSVFIRRAFLDLLGVIPTATEARAFVTDRNPAKRAQLVDQLMERPEFADFWALKWADLFRLEERALDRKGAQLFREWLAARVADHTPLDVFARELLTARGSTYTVPAANWFRAHRTPIERSEAVAQVFLGTRLQCAQCHNHPYERWTQNDYHDWTAAFARVDYKVVENRRRDENDKHEFVGEQLIFVRQDGAHKHPRTGTNAEPRLLGRPDRLAVRDDEPTTADPLRELARWLTAPENPLFARAQANRIWYHLMGRGLVDPVDDFRSTNPASHPALLELLQSELVKSEFDLRHLVRMIMASHTYQMAAQPADLGEEDAQNFSHSAPRRLGAEQLLDSLSRAAGVPLEIPGLPPGTRAAQLPGVVAESRRGKAAGSSDTDRFLLSFGKPPRLMTSECERSCEPAMNQVFQLISGPTMDHFVSAAGNCLGAASLTDRPAAQRLEDLYWAALSRAPSSRESEQLLDYVSGNTSRSRWEDILWSLLNAKEFVLRE